MPDLRFRGSNPARATAKLELVSVAGGTLTANTTTKFYLPPIGRKAIFLRVSSVCLVKPADADGTILARAVKWDGSSEIQLSNDIDLEAGTIRVPQWADALPSAAESALFIKPTESLQINVVNNSAAIDTQATSLTFTVEVAIIE